MQFLASILAFFMFSFNLSTFTVTADDTVYEPRVYITKTGSYYHSTDCHYLHSKIAIGLYQAKKRGYSACSYCKGKADGWAYFSNGDYFPVAPDDKPNIDYSSTNSQQSGDGANWIWIILVGAAIIFFIYSKFLSKTKQYDKSTPQKHNRQNNLVLNDDTKTNITPLIYKESLKSFMDTFRELSEEFGKVDNFEKNCNRLKEKVELLQDHYGYALQNLENRSKALTALGFYYLFNVDELVWIYTRQETTDEQFADILLLIVDALDNENLDDDIDFVIKNIVDGYFMWQQKEILLDKPIEILPKDDE